MASFGDSILRLFKKMAKQQDQHASADGEPQLDGTNEARLKQLTERAALAAEETVAEGEIVQDPAMLTRGKACLQGNFGNTAGSREMRKISGLIDLNNISHDRDEAEDQGDSLRVVSFTRVISYRRLDDAVDGVLSPEHADIESPLDEPDSASIFAGKLLGDDAVDSASSWASTPMDTLAPGKTVNPTEESFKQVAVCPTTSPATLAWLASQPSSEIRSAVASNHHVPQETLRKLSADPDAMVRLAVASNKRTTDEVLRHLTHDDNRLVAGEAFSALTLREKANAQSSGPAFNRFAPPKVNPVQAKVPIIGGGTSTRLPATPPLTKPALPTPNFSKTSSVANYIPAVPASPSADAGKSAPVKDASNKNRVDRPVTETASSDKSASDKAAAEKLAAEKLAAPPVSEAQAAAEKAAAEAASQAVTAPSLKFAYAAPPPQTTARSPLPAAALTPKSAPAPAPKTTATQKPLPAAALTSPSSPAQSAPSSSPASFPASSPAQSAPSASPASFPASSPAQSAPSSSPASSPAHSAPPASPASSPSSSPQADSTPVSPKMVTPRSLPKPTVTAVPPKSLPSSVPPTLNKTSQNLSGPAKAAAAAAGTAPSVVPPTTSAPAPSAAASPDTVVASQPLPSALTRSENVGKELDLTPPTGPDGHDLLTNHKFKTTSNHLVASYTDLDAISLEMDNRSPNTWLSLNSEGAIKAYKKQKDTVKDVKMNLGAHNPNGPKRTSPLVNITPNATASETIAFLKLVAGRVSTPPGRLIELSEHSNEEVRAAVAENVNLPVDAFLALAKDTVSTVKLRLIDNPACPTEVLATLQNDGDPYVGFEAKNALKRLRTGLLKERELNQHKGHGHSAPGGTL